MNAPLPPEAVAVATLPVAHIVASPSNPRKHFDADYIAELAASIKSHGLIQPITVRPLPLDGLLEYNRAHHDRADPGDVPTYELVVGECRWRAAKLAGLTEIPGFWRELDDKQVLEIQVIENLQRRDVHPIEEAEGYQQLMQRHGYSADAIAAKIGKSRAYVYARLKLTALHTAAREAFFAGQLEASTALLIARIPGAALQKKAVKEITCGYDNQPLTYRNAQNHIRHHFTTSLQQATFPLHDAALAPTAGSCEACPKRSGNAPELCADLDDADVCTDTQCFDDKKTARRLQLIANAEQQGIKVYSGTAASEFAPYGLHSLDADEYVSLDEAVEGDGQDRTYREILGDQAPVAALLETGHGPRASMLELGDPTALAAALRQAGWQPDLLQVAEQTEEGAEARQKREEGIAAREAIKIAAEAENTWRAQVRDAVATKLKTASDGSLNTDPIITAIAAAWLRQEVSYTDELPGALLKQWDVEIPEEYDTSEETARICEEMGRWSVGKALAFLFSALTEHEERVSEYTFDPGTDPLPHTMLAIAAAIDFNPASLRPAPPDSPATAADPTQAAQAHEEGAEPAAPEKPKKKVAAKKPKAKTGPAPATPANEPAAPVKPGLGAWPFPVEA